MGEVNIHGVIDAPKSVMLPGIYVPIWIRDGDDVKVLCPWSTLTVLAVEKSTRLHVALEDAREKTPRKGRPIRHARCTMRKQKQSTKIRVLDKLA